MQHAAPGRELFVLGLRERHGRNGIQQLRALARAHQIPVIFESRNRGTSLGPRAPISSAALRLTPDGDGCSDT